MNIDYVEVLNQETGERGRIPRHWFESRAINAGILVEVDATQKPYVAGLFKSRLSEPAEDFGPALPEPPVDADEDPKEED